MQNAKVFGKTGTAENPHGEDHAWFIGWMKYYEKSYSIVVLLENSGSGGAVAAPIAKIFLIRLFIYQIKIMSLINVNNFREVPIKLLWSVAFLLFIRFSYS